MRPHRLIASVTVATAVTAAMAYAGDEATSLSYISYLERYATVQAAESKDTTDAVVNMPVITGDRLDTARGARLEVQLADGSTLWLDEFSTLDFDSLAASRENPAARTVLFLQEGTAGLEIPATSQGDGTTRVDSPRGTLFLSRPGVYRLDLHAGQLHVEAHDGLAELPAGVGSVLLRTGQEAVLDGSDQVQKATLAAENDDFWAWVEERRHPAPATKTAEVVGAETAGRAAVLDSYGTWVHVDSSSTWAWRPYAQDGWSPYSHGRWYWTPVGWNWVSYEPWGWYPYHYGSWYLDASYGWLWCWDWVWGPAWVHWIYTPGYVGWCPRGYYDWWYFDHFHHGEHGWGDGPGRHTPGRWGDVAFDFSGRVRLRDVDPRPWNMVRTDQFTNARLDRVRVDPGRVLREADGDARGIVRSGPLITPPSRGDVERDLDSRFRASPGERSVPDLDHILGRSDQPIRDLPESTPLRPVRTGDLVAAPRGGAERGAEPGAPAAGGHAWSRRSTPAIDAPGTARRPRSSVGRGDATGGGSDGPVGATPSRGQSPSSEPARGEPTREPSVPRSRELQPAPSRPAPSRAQPSTPRQPGYAARIRSYEGTLSGGAESGAVSRGTGSWREENWVVTTDRGERRVRVYSPESGAARAGTPARRLVTREATQTPGSYSVRPPLQDRTRGTGYGEGARSGSTDGARGGYVAPSRRSYQPAPASGYTPRSSSSPSYSPRSYSAPSSPAPRSVSAPSGGSYRAAPSPSHSGSSPAAHSHGHR